MGLTPGTLLGCQVAGFKEVPWLVFNVNYLRLQLRVSAKNETNLLYIKLGAFLRLWVNNPKIANIVGKSMYAQDIKPRLVYNITIYHYVINQ